MFQVGLDASLPITAELGSGHLFFFRGKFSFVAHPDSVKRLYVLNNHTQKTHTHTHTQSRTKQILMKDSKL